MTLLFAAMLGINRLFVAEREQGGFDAFLLAPVDRGAMLFAKAGALFIFLTALEVVAVPAFGLLLLGSSLCSRAPRPDPGAGACQRRAVGDRDAGVGDRGPHPGAGSDRADLGLPLLVPALIATARAIGPLLRAVHPSGSPPGQWLAILALYDSVFALLAYAVFDFLLED